MASGPVTSWQIEGGKVEAVTDFLSLSSKITVDGDCSHEIRRQESYDKSRQCVAKQRHYSADKGSYSQGCGLPSGHVRLWELNHKEGRMLKNWCLRTMVLEKTPEGPLNSKEIKPVNLKGNQPWILVGGTDELKLKLPYFGHVMWTDSLEKSLILGRIEGRRRRGRQRMRCLDGITNTMNMNLDKLWKMVRDRKPWHAAVHEDAKSWIRMGNWTTTECKAQRWMLM